MPRKVFNSILVAAILLATLSAALLAYGTDSYWGQHRHGMGLILFTHRVQWILAAFSLILCLGVVGMIVGGYRRSWWLITLGPVLALFVHRFVANPMRQFAIVENPPCAAAAEATFVRDDDYVVGVQFGDAYFAYPYTALFTAPVILQSNHEQRFILFWSPFANRAMAFRIDREIKLSELQIVSTPANALFVYNGRVGHFINGLTGETSHHEHPAGLHAQVETQKLTWRHWKTLHPATLVLPPRDGRTEPSTPVIPKYPLPPPAKPIQGAAATRPVETTIVLIPTTRPIAIPSDAVGRDPANISLGETQIFIVRDDESGALRAFDRRIKEDLFPLFRRKTDARRAIVAFEDQDSGTTWTADGKAIDGPLKGEQLKPVHVEDMLYWGVMKSWYPELQWVTPAQSLGAGNFNNPGDPRRRRPR